MSRFTSDEVTASIRSRSSTSYLNLGLFWGSSSSSPSSVDTARGRRTGGAPSARHSARSGPARGSSPLDTWSRQARRLPQQNTERPSGNRRNVKSKQSAPVSNELREPFKLQSTQVIKLDQRQEAFSAMQHARVQLEFNSSFGNGVCM